MSNSKDINNHNKGSIDDKFYKKRMRIFYDIFDKYETKFTPFMGKIYCLKNIKNKKLFFGGSEGLMTKEMFLKNMIKNKKNDKLLNDLKKYKIDDFKFKLIEKYRAKSPFEFMFRIDYYKTKYKTIENGYNIDYNLPESERLFNKSFQTISKNLVERNIFLRIQKELLSRKVINEYNFDNIFGFVYMIENIKNKKKYFDYAMNTSLKSIILGMYDKALEGNIKHNKILKVLQEEPYYHFRFKTIKIKSNSDTKTNIKDETDRLIKKFNTIESGYNIDYQELDKRFKY